MLQYDTQLAAKAQKFADTLMDSMIQKMNEGKRSYLYHDTKSNLEEDMGENLYRDTSSESGKMGMYCKRAHMGWYVSMFCDGRGITLKTCTK